ncbi:MAG: hypothetical protein Q8Q39_05725 [bacterium]|nr:hypothetical protein [bacterium]
MEGIATPMRSTESARNDGRILLQGQSLFMFIHSAYAATDDELRQAISGWSTQDIYAMFDAASQWVLVFGIIAAVIAFIIGGYALFTSRGNPAEVATGKKTLLWAAAGLALIVVARGIVYIIGNFFS